MLVTVLKSNLTPIVRWSLKLKYLFRANPVHAGYAVS